MPSWIPVFTVSELIAILASAVALLTLLIQLLDRRAAKAIALNEATIKNLETLVSDLRQHLAEQEAKAKCEENNAADRKKELAEAARTIIDLQGHVSSLQERMARYPSLVLRQGVYWFADPECADTETALCPECWNTKLRVSPLDRSKRVFGRNVGTCTQHSTPILF